MVLLMHRCPMQSTGLALGPRAGLTPKTKIVLSPCKKNEMAFAQKKKSKNEPRKKRNTKKHTVSISSP